MVKREDDKGRGRTSAVGPRPLLSYAPEFLYTDRRNPLSSNHRNLNPHHDGNLRPAHIEAGLDGLSPNSFPYGDRKTLIEKEMAAVKAELNSYLPETPSEREVDTSYVRPRPYGRLVDDKPVLSAPVPSDDLASLVPPTETLSRPPRRRVTGLLLTTTILGSFAGACVALFYPPLYVSTAELLVTPPNRAGELTSAPVLTAAAQKMGVASVRDLGEGGLTERVIGQLEHLLVGPNGTLVNSAGVLRKHLTVVKNSDNGIVSVVTKTPSAEKSSLMAIAIAQAFQQHLSNIQPGENAQNATADRLLRLETDAVAAEKMLGDFRQTRNFTPADADQVTAAQQELSVRRAETERISANGDALRKASPDSLAQNGLPEDLRGGTLGSLLPQFVAAQTRLSDLSAKLGPRHPNRIEQQKLVDGLRSTLEAELLKLRNMAQADLKQAVEREQAAAQRVASQKTVAPSEADRSRLRDLERDAATRRALYDDVKLRAARGELALASTDGASVRVISAAVPAETPNGLPLAPMAGLGGLGGLVLGLLIAALRRPRRAVPEPLIVQPLDDAAPLLAADEPAVQPSEPMRGESRLEAAIRSANERWEAENGVQPTRAGRIAEVKKAIVDVRAAMSDYQRRKPPTD